MPTPGATAMTFSSLIEDIMRYVETGGDDSEAANIQMPRIVNNTERQLATQLKIQGYIGTYTSQMQTNQAVISKPQAWRSTVSINFGSGPSRNRRTTLRLRSLEYIRAMFPNQLSLGEPQFYADYDLDHWWVSPTPSDAFPFEAQVYMLPPLLSEANQTNYLTQYAPNLLLFACLGNMEAFLRNDSRIAVWQAQAKEVYDGLNVEDLRRMVDRGQERSTD
ncbi:MAG: hypothetical protein WC670_20500 [Pseudolabrys sp.]|jgi:hypothetical protein